MSSSRSRSSLATQRSRCSGRPRHQASCRSTSSMSTTSSHWKLDVPAQITRRQRFAPVPPLSSRGSHPGVAETSLVPSRSSSPSPVPSHTRRSPSLLPSRSSCSPSPAPRSSSPSPVRSPSPQPQLPFPRSPGYVTTDSEDDRCQGYLTPVPRGHTLCIFNHCGVPRCPICPSRANRQWTRVGAKNHVLGFLAASSTTDEKRKSHHRALVGNEGWFPPLGNAAAE